MDGCQCKGKQEHSQVTGQESFKKERPSRPLKIAESDADVKLSRLCEQDKILQELEARIRSLKEDKVFVTYCRYCG
ncbi:Pleckstrin y domain-containing A member 7 [Ameca splendens]|uniref:Pleckstrin y domain-containing A member 7 n=1 Tax=Ameca splendens TaxID=208324 RepID=A0ABV1AFK9_9TELE